MSLQITTDDWLLKLDTAVESDNNQYNLGQFTNAFVLISVESNNALPAWNKAGSVSQAISTASGIAYSTRQDLDLRKLNLLTFSAIATESYQLYYFPLTRLGTVQIKVYEYQGGTNDVVLQQLITALNGSSVLSANFLEIESKITLFSDRIDSLASKIDKLAAVNSSDNSNLTTILNLILNAIGVPTPTPLPVAPTALEQAFFFLQQ